jgi:hypothetical protein
MVGKNLYIRIRNRTVMQKVTSNKGEATIQIVGVVAIITLIVGFALFMAQ